MLARSSEALSVSGDGSIHSSLHLAGVNVQGGHGKRRASRDPCPRPSIASRFANPGKYGKSKKASPNLGGLGAGRAAGGDQDQFAGGLGVAAKHTASDEGGVAAGGNL